MNLRELVKTHGVETIVTEYYRNGKTWDRKALTKESKATIEQMVIDWFKDLGWKTKSKKRINGFISRKGKEHTKILWNTKSALGP